MFRKSITLAFLCLAVLACKNDPKPGAAQIAPKADAPAATPTPPDGSTTFTITEGAVNWSIKNTVGKGGHQGTISVKSGELWVNQGQIFSGAVTLDMNSVSVTDIKEPQERLDLESHLKNSDFFETDKFPQAAFMFTEVAPSAMPNFNAVISGDLTMRDKTAPVKFPVKVSIEGDVLRAESASFLINRTNWGVNFHSGILGTAKDQMINDSVSISLKVVAKKK